MSQAFLKIKPDNKFPLQDKDNYQIVGANDFVFDQGDRSLDAFAKALYEEVERTGITTFNYRGYIRADWSYNGNDQWGGGYVYRQNTLTNGYNPIFVGIFIEAYGSTYKFIIEKESASATSLKNAKITWRKIWTDYNAVAISNGGTGASSKKAAAHNLIDLGNNIISSTSNDTGATWKNFGLGIAGFNTAGLLNGQPTQYGTLLNMITNNKGDFSQLWIAQASGETYSRSSNGNNLSTTWRRHLDSDNLNLWFKCGTSSTPSGNTYGIYIQY